MEYIEYKQFKERPKFLSYKAEEGSDIDLKEAVSNIQNIDLKIQEEYQKPPKERGDITKLRMQQLMMGLYLNANPLDVNNF